MPSSMQPVERNILLNQAFSVEDWCVSPNAMNGSTYNVKPFWIVVDGDVVNPCFEQIVLQTLVPALVLFALALSAMCCSHRRQSHSPSSSSYSRVSNIATTSIADSESQDRIIRYKRYMLIMAALATTLVASQFALAVWSLVDLVTASNGGRPLPDFATLLSSITRATTWFIVLAISIIANIRLPQTGPSPFRLYFFFIISSFLHFLIVTRSHIEWVSVFEFLACLVLVVLDIGVRYLDAYYEPPSASEDGNDRPMSLEEDASIISRAFFSWLTPMIMIGNRRPLEDTDMWEMKECDQSSICLRKYNIAKLKTKSVYKRLLHVVGRLLTFQIACGFNTSILSFAGPFFLNRIVNWIQKPDNSIFGAWIYLFALFICAVLKAINDGQMYFTGRRVGLQIRAILVGEIYEKSLKRAMTAGGAASSKVSSTDKEEKEELEKNNNSNTDDNDDEDATETDKLLPNDSENQDKSASTAAADEDKKKKEVSSSTSSSDASQGKIVTLMSVDTESIRTFVSYLHDDIIRLPLSTILAFTGLLLLLGWSALAGLGTLLVMGPLTAYLSKRANDLQTELMESTDDRVNITNEVLQGIRIIKYFAWEPQFIEKILKFRNIELRKYFNLWIVWAAFGIVSYGGGVIVSFTTFAFYTVVQKQVLDPATAFTALSLLHRLSKELGFIPLEIAHIMQMKVSMDRIIDFLKEPELEKYSGDDVALTSSSSCASSSSSDEIVGFDTAKFMYLGSAGSMEQGSTEKPSSASSTTTAASASSAESLTNGPSFVLRDLNVQFPSGKLSVICGQTGAGKTSVVLALLGELKRIYGSTMLPDPRLEALSPTDPTTGLTRRGVAYVAQTAWMLNATVRDNILFGRPFDAERYWKVIDACALTRDLETLDAGDMTEIGEKGVNLSGGQKQRISLARAAYSSASYILLDDPLSAVDAPTARHLLYKCILGPIMSKRTIILVSHAVGLVLPRADFVVVMKNGAISAKGTPRELANGEHLQGIFSAEVLAKGPESFLDENNDMSEVESHEPSLEKSAEDLAHAVGRETEAKKSEQDRKKSGKLVNAEEKATGSVRWAVYWAYLRAAGGIKFFMIFITSYFFMFGADLSFAWWLKQWSDAGSAAAMDNTNQTTSSDFSSSNMLFSVDTDEFSVSKSGLSIVLTTLLNIPKNETLSTIASSTPNAPIDVMFYIKYYALFGFLVMLAQNFNMIIQLIAGLYAARKLHIQLLGAVLGAPMRFFEITPIGRILNRFSKDISGVDMSVMNSLGLFVQSLFQIFGILGIISSVTPVFLAFILPILSLYVWVARSYLNASRELKRLESVSRSPIYAQFSETLAGVSTIRGYGQELRFIKNAEKRVDGNHRSFFYLWASNRWLCLRTDIISACVVFVSGCAILLGKVEAGWAGLTLSYSLEFTECLLWLVRAHAEMEMNMNCVERVQEYSDIDQEPPAVIESNRPPADWPMSGQVQVEDLSISYSPELPHVLKSLTFSTSSAEKIGVVGRTGAGKSTLSLAFFRILPFANGKICIDGVDISQIGLRDLRTRLTIIPQDPVLFSGTLRSNLDPVDEHDDAAIWQALKRVHFLDSLQQAESKKDVTEEEDTSSSSKGKKTGLSASSSKSSLATTRSSSHNSISTTTSVDSSATAANDNGSISNISLDAQVSENGSNFSQGQRQLLCLARAILRRSKFIILDEATASVDNSTDAQIQETIRQEFKHSTLLCIAHRLRTVVDYDRILVLDRGEISQFGTPYELMTQSDGGIFKSMCEESGEFDELLTIATAKHNVASI